MYCIKISIYRFLLCKPNRSAFSVFQLEKKVRLKVRERWKGNRENKGTKRRREEIPERREIDAKNLVWTIVRTLRRERKRSWRVERTEKESRCDVITKVDLFGSKIELRLKNQEENFEFNAGVEGESQ